MLSLFMFVLLVLVVPVLLTQSFVDDANVCGVWVSGTVAVAATMLLILVLLLLVVLVWLV